MGRIPGIPFEVSAATSTIVLVIVLDLLLVQSCSAPPFPHDPALHGDFRNPHSLNLTCLHQRRRDGNKSYPSETKTVQILLWPGRRPSFHFNHFQGPFHQQCFSEHSSPPQSLSTEFLASSPPCGQKCALSETQGPLTWTPGRSSKGKPKGH